MKKAISVMIPLALILFTQRCLSQQEEILFFEDMELPDVAAMTNYSQGAIPDGWIGANTGFGSGSWGLIDYSGGTNFVSPDPSTNQQAMAFHYENAGMTTAEGVIGEFFLETTYTLEFDVYDDLSLLGANKYNTNYLVRLMVMTNGTDRTNCQSTPAGAFVLATSTGQLPDSSPLHLTMSYTPHLTNDLDKVGMDLTVRIGKMPGPFACIDNVSVKWIAPPPKGTVISLR
jgi:hypothetical protein